MSETLPTREAIPMREAIPIREAIQMIDIGNLLSPDASARKGVAAKIGDACRSVGFFYVTGHEMTGDRLQAVFEASRVFFAQPLEVKRSLARSRVGDNRGYVEVRQERLDLAAPPDKKEAFNIGLELAVKDPGRDTQAGANAWPDIPGWRALMLDYYDRCWRLGRLLHRAFSLDLGLPEDFFEDKLDCPKAILRLLHYPARHAVAEEGPGAGAHTDYGNLTLLMGDGVAGLQIKPRNGAWIDAPHVADAFICNIGDCLMRWSNDTYVSTPHRVVAPERERYSIAFFLDPNADALVEPIVAAGEHPAKYPPIKAADFLESRLNPTYGG